MPDSNFGRPTWQRKTRWQEMEVRRALDPDTGLPFPKLTTIQKAKLTMTRKLFDWFIKGWLARQVLKYITIAGAAIGATSDDVTATASFLISGAAFLVELACSFLSRKWLKKQPAQS